MKFAAKLVLFAALFTLSQQGQAQNVPTELQGLYAGSITISSFESKTKFKALGSIDITDEDSVTLTIDGDVLPGDTGVSEDARFLFVRADIAPDVFLSGILQVKGKPGKESLRGDLYFVLDRIVGIAKYSVKLKRPKTVM